MLNKRGRILRKKCHCVTKTQVSLPIQTVNGLVVDELEHADLRIALVGREFGERGELDIVMLLTLLDKLFVYRCRQFWSMVIIRSVDHQIWLFSFCHPCWKFR